MTKSSSTRVRHGFKHRLHFLRRESEGALNIGNPIVAFEDGHGRFSPRRPEPGETHPDTRCYNSDVELNDFLFKREINCVNHSLLLQEEKKWGISPYFEFVENPEAHSCIYPGLPSYGGFYEALAFPIWLDRAVLEYRARALTAIEYRDAIFAGFLIAPFRERGCAELEHGSPALKRITENVEARRKVRWFQPRKNLPHGAPRFYRDAQVCKPWYECDDGRRTPDTGSLDDWS